MNPISYLKYKLFLYKHSKYNNFLYKERLKKYKVLIVYNGQGKGYNMYKVKPYVIKKDGLELKKPTPKQNSIRRHNKKIVSKLTNITSPTSTGTSQS